MKIVVCVKQTADGELNPFDASAYEAALRIPDSEVVLLSMGPERTGEMLLNLTRLGAKEAYHLCDPAFAGADTLATAYTLSLAIGKLQPDLVVCGRQTVDGDTAQTGPSLSVMANLNLITNVMAILQTDGQIECETRNGNRRTASYPALITVERINTLRLPSIRSKKGTVTRWQASDLGADMMRCGTKGSPTRVMASYTNAEGKRKCQYISASQLLETLEAGLKKEKSWLQPVSRCETPLSDVWIVGEAPRPFAENISDDITVIDKKQFETGAEKCDSEASRCTDTRVFAEKFAVYAKQRSPKVILWGSDSWSKTVAPQVAALLQTGLCADCTALETDGDTLFMYRPAFSGNIIAKIVCGTRPAMATVRTVESDSADIIVSVGKGAQESMAQIEAFVERQNTMFDESETSFAAHGPDAVRVKWDMAASRGAVDTDLQPYHRQVGITGKSVSPAVYLAVGISGAVHHIAGMKQSGTVIAINPDPKAPIFEYADYGVIGTIEEVLDHLLIFKKSNAQKCKSTMRAVKIKNNNTTRVS